MERGTYRFPLENIVYFSLDRPVISDKLILRTIIANPLKSGDAKLQGLRWTDFYRYASQLPNTTDASVYFAIEQTGALFVQTTKFRSFGRRAKKEFRFTAAGSNSKELIQIPNIGGDFMSYALEHEEGFE